MKVIASKYIIENGQVLLEIVSLGRGKYIIARNGQIEDARRKLTRPEVDGILQDSDWVARETKI